MEGRSVVTALFFTILAACSKQDIHQNSFRTVFPSQHTEIKPQLYSSGWETVPRWKTQKTSEGIIFAYSKQVTDLSTSALKNAVVLVCARNLWADDPALKELDKEPEKPLMMPFYFLPYFERPNYTEEWKYSVEENKINISLLVKGGDNASAPGKKIQLRFLVIPEEALKQKKQSAQTVRKLSYDQLVKIFSLAS